MKRAPSRTRSVTFTQGALNNESLPPVVPRLGVFGAGGQSTAPLLASPSRRRKDEEAVSDGEEDTAELPPEGPLLSGTFVGCEMPEDAKGRVEVGVVNGEFWLTLKSPEFYNISEADYPDTFLYLSKRKEPMGGNVTLEKAVLVPVPTADGTGSLPEPPPAKASGATFGVSLTDRRFCLKDVLDKRRDKARGVPVDPRRFRTLVVAKVLGGGSKLGAFAYARLVPAGTTEFEVASARAEVYRRGSLSLGPTLGPEFKGSELAPLDLASLSYAQLHTLAEACFGQLGKPKVGGHLVFSEFLTVLAQLGLRFTEARAFVWFDCGDEDGSGTMEFEEFRHLMAFVSRVATPTFLTLWDVYTVFAVDNKAEAKAREEAQGRWEAGIVGAEKPPDRPPVRETLPRVDVLALKAILQQFRYDSGIKLSDEKLEAMFRLKDARTNAGTLGYEQVKSIWMELVSPKAELGKRGLSVDALLAERHIRSGDEAALRAHLGVVVAREEAGLRENLMAGLLEAERMKIEWENDREAERLAELERRMVDKKTARKKKYLERQLDIARRKEDQSKEALDAMEASLIAAMDSLDGAGAEESTRVEKELRLASARIEAARRARMGTDILGLAGRGMQFLPPMMWETGEGRERLAHLVILDISNNSLIALPGKNMFAHCALLRKLDVSANRLRTLPQEVGALPSLLILQASHNVLDTLPPTLGKLTQLQRLNLSSNRLTEVAGGDLLGGLVSLRDLDLGNNLLSSLPPSLFTLPSLRDVNLQSNALVYLPEFKAIRRLQRLNLASNALTELPLSLGSAVRLTHLDLSNNRLRYLPPTFGGAASLTHLNISRNRLKTLPLNFGNLTRLVLLEASENAITGLQPSHFAALLSLQRADLSRNQVDYLPPSIGLCQELQALNLSKNRLRALPREISGLTALRHLDLHFNALGAGGVIMFPPTMGLLTSLVWLDASFNLASRVCPEVALMPALQHLNLSNNAFTEVSEDMLGGPALETLDLSVNAITRVSRKVGECPKLRALDLSVNRIATLPPGISNCTSLRHLHLYNNALTSLPYTLAWLLPQLLSFDVGKNPLRGLPPKWVTEEVLGAEAVLSLRFSRERKDKMQVTLRRARARAIARFIAQERADEEDVRDRERLGMLREDTRARKLGPGALVVDLAEYGTSMGANWGRTPTGALRDTQKEWSEFIEEELAMDEAERVKRVKAEAAAEEERRHAVIAAAIAKADEEAELRRGGLNAAEELDEEEEREGKGKGEREGEEEEEEESKTGKEDDMEGGGGGGGGGGDGGGGGSGGSGSGGDGGGDDDAWGGGGTANYSSVKQRSGGKFRGGVNRGTSSSSNNQGGVSSSPTPAHTPSEGNPGLGGVEGGGMEPLDSLPPSIPRGPKITKFPSLPPFNAPTEAELEEEKRRKDLEGDGRALVDELNELTGMGAKGPKVTNDWLLRKPLGPLYKPSPAELQRRVEANKRVIEEAPPHRKGVLSLANTPNSSRPASASAVLQGGSGAHRSRPPTAAMQALGKIRRMLAAQNHPMGEEGSLPNDPTYPLSSHPHHHRPSSAAPASGPAATSAGGIKGHFPSALHSWAATPLDIPGYPAPTRPGSVNDFRRQLPGAFDTLTSKSVTVDSMKAYAGLLKAVGYVPDVGESLPTFFGTDDQRAAELKAKKEAEEAAAKEASGKIKVVVVAAAGATAGPLSSHPPPPPSSHPHHPLSVNNPSLLAPPDAPFSLNLSSSGASDSGDSDGGASGGGGGERKKRHRTRTTGRHRHMYEQREQAKLDSAALTAQRMAVVRERKRLAREARMKNKAAAFGGGGGGSITSPSLVNSSTTSGGGGGGDSSGGSDSEGGGGGMHSDVSSTPSMTSSTGYGEGPSSSYQPTTTAAALAARSSNTTQSFDAGGGVDVFSMVTLPPSRGGSRQASRQGGPRVGSSEEQKPSSSSGGGGGGVEGGPAAAPISPPVLPRLPSREGWVGGPSRSRSTSTLSMSSPLSPSRSSPLKKNSTGLDAGLRGSAGEAAGDGSDGGVDGGGSTTSDHSSQPSLDGGGGSFASLPSPSSNHTPPASPTADGGEHSPPPAPALPSNLKPRRGSILKGEGKPYRAPRRVSIDETTPRLPPLDKADRGRAVTTADASPPPVMGSERATQPPLLPTPHSDPSPSSAPTPPPLPPQLPPPPPTSISFQAAIALDSLGDSELALEEEDKVWKEKVAQRTAGEGGRRKKAGSGGQQQQQQEGGGGEHFMPRPVLTQALAASFAGPAELAAMGEGEGREVGTMPPLRPQQQQEQGSTGTSSPSPSSPLLSSTSRFSSHLRSALKSAEGGPRPSRSVSVEGLPPTVLKATFKEVEEEGAPSGASAGGVGMMLEVKEEEEKEKEVGEGEGEGTSEGVPSDLPPQLSLSPSSKMDLSAALTTTNTSSSSPPSSAAAADGSGGGGGGGGPTTKSSCVYLELYPKKAASSNYVPQATTIGGNYQLSEVVRSFQRLKGMVRGYSSGAGHALLHGEHHDIHPLDDTLEVALGGGSRLKALAAGQDRSQQPGGLGSVASGVVSNLHPSLGLLYEAVGEVGANRAVRSTLASGAELVKGVEVSVRRGRMLQKLSLKEKFVKNGTRRGEVVVSEDAGGRRGRGQRRKGGTGTTAPLQPQRSASAEYGEAAQFEKKRELRHLASDGSWVEEGDFDGTGRVSRAMELAGRQLGETEVVGSLSIASVKRLRAKGAQGAELLEDVLSGSLEKRNLEHVKRMASEAKAAERAAKLKVMLKALGLNEAGEVLSQEDKDKLLTAEERELQVALREAKAKEELKKELRTSTGYREDGLMKNFGAATVSVFDYSMNAAAVDAYDDLLAGGVLYLAEKQKGLIMQSKRARLAKTLGMSLTGAGEAVASRATPSLTQIRHTARSATLARVLASRGGAQYTGGGGGGGGRGGAVLSYTQDAIPTVHESLGGNVGGGGNGGVEGDDSFPLSAVTRPSSSATASSSSTSLSGAFPTDAPPHPSTSKNEEVFARAAEAIELKRAEREALADMVIHTRRVFEAESLGLPPPSYPGTGINNSSSSGGGGGVDNGDALASVPTVLLAPIGPDGRYSQTRDPAHLIRSDAFEQEFGVLAAPTSGLAAQRPKFGQGVYADLYSGDPYQRPVAQKGEILFDPDTPLAKKNRRPGEKPPDRIKLRLPDPSEMTGIVIKPTDRVREPPASESGKEKKDLHELRLGVAQREVNKYGHVSGVQFIDTEGEAEYKEDALNLEAERMVAAADREGDKAFMGRADALETEIRLRGEKRKGGGENEEEGHLSFPSASALLSSPSKAAAATAAKPPPANPLARLTALAAKANAIADAGAPASAWVGEDGSGGVGGGGGGGGGAPSSLPRPLPPQPLSSSSTSVAMDKDDLEVLALKAELKALEEDLSGKGGGGGSKRGGVVESIAPPRDDEPADDGFDDDWAALEAAAGGEDGNGGGGEVSFEDRAFIPAEKPPEMDVKEQVVSEDGRVEQRLGMAVLKRTNPFAPPATSLSMSTTRTHSEELRIQLDRGDRNNVVAQSLHKAASFQQGYTSGDIADYLRISATFVPAAEAEWRDRGGAYLERRLGGQDFIRAVRRRLQGRDPLTGLYEDDLYGHLPRIPGAVVRGEPGFRDPWDANLIPNLRRFLAVCLREGIPPLFSDPTPEQAATRARFARVAATYKAQRGAMVLQAVKEQWSEYCKLYVVTPEELARRVRVDTARRDAKKARTMAIFKLLMTKSAEKSKAKLAANAKRLLEEKKRVTEGINEQLKANTALKEAKMRQEAAELGMSYEVYLGGGKAQLAAMQRAAEDRKNGILR